MTTKQKRDLQKAFLSQCVTTTQTLEDLLDDLGIRPQTLVTWMAEREFKSKLHGMRRYLQRARELQLEAASLRAAGLLASLTAPPNGARANPVSRAACVDVIRLARDSRVRRRAQHPDEVNRQRRLAHPDLSDEEVDRLLREFDGVPSDPKKDQPPTQDGH